MATAPSSRGPRASANGTLTPPDAWNASDVSASGGSPTLEQAQRVALHRPHPAQRRPAGRPLQHRGAAVGIDDRERAVGRAVEARRRHLGREATIGAGDDGTGSEAGAVGSRQTTGVGGGQRLEDHHLREQAGVDAAERLRQVEAAEREAVEHVEHRRWPAAGGLVLADVRRQLAAPESLGRGGELVQLRRELEPPHGTAP